MRRVLKFTALALAALFISVQFVRPNRTNPPVEQGRTIEAHTRITPEVAQVFERACKDCHSNRTAWPWYTHVAPVSWYVADHVEHGRRNLNFSEWSTYDQEQADWLLGAICMTATRGSMPLDSYTRLHHAAKLSPADVQTLCAWSQTERDRMSREANRGKRERETGKG
ncbi:MAG TPA: heme-binding domain-containing protein [Pyrinomonadaceae bacterium]|nr:heme-binding domain-containing protein [Pyrinomonadaceae bacterium]